MVDPENQGGSGCLYESRFQNFGGEIGGANICFLDASSSTKNNGKKKEVIVACALLGAQTYGGKDAEA